MLFNFVFNLFKDLLNYKNCVTKACFQRGFIYKKSVIYKENFVCKEKSGSATKVKLVTKIKKHDQLYFGTLVLAIYGLLTIHWLQRNQQHDA